MTLPPGIHDLEIYSVTGIRAPPLGLAYLAAVLERAGHKVRILDTATLGMDFRSLLREVKSFNPDIVGFSLLTPTAPRGYTAAKALKELLPGVVTITGGPHATFMYEEALSNGFDLVVRGEGEATLLELVEVIDKHGLDPARLREVRGIAFWDRREGRIVATPPRPFIEDLSSLPWPARHLLPMDKYTLLGKPIRVAHVMASRGCPYGCAYCTTSYFWGRRVRLRRPEDVASEVEYLVEKYKAKYVVFCDDEFTISRPFVEKLLGELRDRGVDVPFACGGRVDHMSRDFMKLLYDSGCAVIYFGVESGSQETLDRIGKKITLEQARRVFQWKRELGGFAIASFILGFPWETVSDMKRTVDFAIELDPDYAQFTALTPYPGTPLFDYAKKEQLIEDWDWEHYTTLRPVMRGFAFRRDQVSAMLKYAYRRFYLRARFLWRELRAHRLFEVLKITVKELSSLFMDKLKALI